jgi:hypothetical protein
VVQLGEDTSTLKDSAMKVAANLQGMMHAMSSDEVLKNALASAFEQFEAASYRMLVSAGGCRRAADRVPAKPSWSKKSPWGASSNRKPRSTFRWKRPRRREAQTQSPE